MRVWLGATAAFFLLLSAARGAELAVNLEGASDKVVSAEAVIRSEKEVRIKGELADGRIIFKDLAPGIYDVVLQTKIGIIEGVNLKPYDEVGKLESESEFGKLPGKDFKEILDRAIARVTFEESRRIFEIRGHAKRARVLVEQFMDKDTSLPSPEPQVFWRMEIWIYRYWYGGWQRDKRYEMIDRRKMARREFDAFRWVYEPDLGGIQIEKSDEHKVIRYKVPQELDPARGVVDGKRPEPKLAPPEASKEEEVEKLE